MAVDSASRVTAAVSVAAGLFAAALCGRASRAAEPAKYLDWPQWRGPFFNGSTTDPGPSDDWSETQGAAWKADLPGVGGSTPIVRGRAVFVSAIDAETLAVYALCLDRDTGKQRWKRDLGRGFRNTRGNTAASPSPIADGQRAYFLFGTGDFIAYDLNGREVWRRNLQADHGRFELMWSYGASPVLHDGKLYVPVLHGDHRSRSPAASYLLCVDPKTGKDLWKHERVIASLAESKQAYTTPYPYRGPKGWRIALAGADHVTAHDPADGTEVWRSGSYNPRNNPWLRTIVSPVGAGGMIVACAPKGGRIHAVRAGSSGKLGDDGWAWTARGNSPDVCTPLAYDGKLYVLDGDRKTLVCLEPDTGHVVWRGDFGGPSIFQASPTGAGGKIYCIGLAGQVVVAQAGSEFRVLKRVDLGATGCRSTIAVAGKQLFIRTDRTLYCIGKDG